MKSISHAIIGVVLAGAAGVAIAAGSSVSLQCSSPSGGQCTATGTTVPLNTPSTNLAFTWQGRNITMTPIDAHTVSVQCLTNQAGSLTALAGSSATQEPSATVAIDCTPMPRP
ncbi:hypothetical protein B7G54_36755 [Burkholderia puraquae]|uniref:Ig-like domain-containing protein n=1 Tax=Burkholderia puraquae TaxID=1904757 RepID=A0A1X1P5C7_9BURK|nr:hypothetical protein [Burkholderia puraquae]ORT79510.1 hypothetical protein B7G54_36755 [Burkholderia puraquae]CAB3772335.1 hypothetical protein LMG29660_07131 [Burkholderia puraquae]